MKKVIGVVLLCFVFSILGADIIWPAFHRKTDPEYEKMVRDTEFESESASSERILCIDDNEEALLWR